MQQTLLSVSDNIQKNRYECKQKKKKRYISHFEIKQKQKATIGRDCAKRQPLQIKSSFLFTTTVDKEIVLGKSHKAFVLLQPSSPILFTPLFIASPSCFLLPPHAYRKGVEEREHYSLLQLARTILSSH